MKKRLTLVISLILLVVFCICVVQIIKSQEESSNHSFLAVVTEINGSSMYVRPVENSKESISYDKFIIFTDKITDKLNPQVGDTYKIVYSGVVVECDPPELQGIESITLKSKKK